MGSKWSMLRVLDGHFLHVLVHGNTTVEVDEMYRLQIIAPAQKSTIFWFSMWPGKVIQPSEPIWNHWFDFLGYAVEQHQGVVGTRSHSRVQNEAPTA